MVFSAASKLTSPIEFRDELHSYGLLDVRASMFAALYLILLELGMGLSFWRKASRGVSFVAAALLFSVFLCALAYKRSLGDTNHCGCFGSSTPGTLAQMVWLDTVLLAVCVLGPSSRYAGISVVHSNRYLSIFARVNLLHVNHRTANSTTDDYGRAA